MVLDVNGAPLSVPGAKAAFFNNQVPRGQSLSIGANNLLRGQLFIDLTGITSNPQFGGGSGSGVITNFQKAQSLLDGFRLFIQ